MRFRLWLVRKLLPKGWKLSPVKTGWRKKPKEPVKVKLLPLEEIDHA